MRSVASGLFTAIAILCMIVAVPSVWFDQRVVSTDGFVASAKDAARTTEVQDYFAQKVADSVPGIDGVPIAENLVLPAAKNYARSEGFVEDFADVARQQHDWLFTQPPAGADLHIMNLDITPMINRVLRTAPVEVPTVTQPVTISIDQNSIAAGSMEDTGTLATGLAWGSVIGGLIAAVLALITARRRSTVLAWLGLGGILAGAVGAATATVAQRIVNDHLASSDDAARNVIEVVTSGILHNLTVVSTYVGVAGVAVALIGLVARVAVGRR